MHSDRQGPVDDNHRNYLNGATLRKLVLGFGLVGLMLAAPIEAQLKGGKFKIERKRSSGSEVVSIIGVNNSISSKPPLRGDYSYIAAVYAEPKATIGRNGDRKARLVLMVRAETATDPATGRKACLGKLRALKFILDGRNFASFPIDNPQTTLRIGATYDSMTGSWWNVISETGTVELTREELHYLASAKGVSVKLEGSDLSVVVNQGDVAKSFLSNLKKFDLALKEEEARRSWSTQHLAGPNSMPG